MQNILQDLKRAEKNHNIFVSWQEELVLRQQARNIKPNQVVFNSLAEIDFLCRSWYFSGQMWRFLSSLYENMSNHLAIEWLKSQPLSVLKDFLFYIKWIVMQKNVPSNNLLFLIHIFNPEWAEHFIPLIEQLDLEQSTTILEKTANQKLRELLNLKIKTLNAERSDELYGIVPDQVNYQPGNFLFKDRQHHLIQTALAINKLFSLQYESADLQYFMQLADAVDNLQQSGLIKDAYTLLIKINELYKEKGRFPETHDDHLFYKRTKSLLNKVLPFIALLCARSDPYSYANACLQLHFPELAESNSALTYLKLYSLIQENFLASIEILDPRIFLECRKLSLSRKNESFLLDALDESEFSVKLMPHMLSIIESRIPSLPHESLILLELLLLMVKLQKILDFPADKMASLYQQLWDWIPSRLIINPNVLSILGPLIAKPIFNKWVRINELQNFYQVNQITQDLITRPELFRNPKDDLRRQILFGIIMEV